MRVNPTAEILGSTIVVVGRFNPAIFTPDWLEIQGLIGSGDAGAARTSSSFMVTGQVAICETDWFRLDVQENRFALDSRGVISPALRDLAVGILAVVQHTPVTALGLNFLSHWKMPTLDDYHQVGDSLAPKEIWQDVFPDLAAGLADLTIRLQRGSRDKAPTSADEVRIQVQPSVKVKHGVFISWNDHRAEFVKEKGADNALTASEVIKHDWQESCDAAMKSFESILAKARPARGE